jgi:hypothetical protein
MLPLGAKNKLTGDYTHPKFAKKTDKFICPDCSKDLILCKGEINVAHFRHKADDNPCNRYNHPGESDFHKDGKEIMKLILNKRMHVTMKLKCCECLKNNITEELDTQYENPRVELEYKFIHKGSSKSADVAYISNTIYIFEIWYSSKTKEENRPDPWFEIDAVSLIKQFGETNNDSDSITIDCRRTRTPRPWNYWVEGNVCKDCLKKYKDETEEIAKIRNESIGDCSFDFDAQTSLDSIEYNNQIIGVFNKDIYFKNNRVVIHSHKGQILVLVFDKYCYEHNRNNSLDYYWLMDINWKYSIDYGSNRARDVIYDLIKFCSTGISRIADKIEKNEKWIDPTQSNDSIKYLNVPFADKGKIKNIGGKWDPNKKLWFVTYKIYSQNEDFIKTFCKNI